jgi:hypothetical protein
MSVRWIMPELLMRGCVIDGVVTGDDDPGLVQAFRQTWQRLTDFVSEFGLPAEVKVVVEIWQDTGRIIFIARQKRELVRIALQCEAIEQRYFSINRKDETEFTAVYETQHRRLVDLLRRSVTDTLSVAISVTDADDSDSAEMIRSLV